MKFPVTSSVYPLVLLALLAAAPARADLNSDLAFSAFQNVDLNALAGGQVLQARGGLLSFPRGISTQSLYLLNAQPAEVAYKLAHWNPATHPELDVWLHQSLSNPPTPASYAGLASLPDNKSVQFQLDSTANFDPESPQLQVSKEEAQWIASVPQKAGKAAFAQIWGQILAGRAAAFLSGQGASSYDVDKEGNVYPLSEVKSLLHSDIRVYGQYQRLLNQTPVKALANANPTGPKLAPADLYCDVFDVQGSAAVGTGAIYQAPSGNSIQSADIEYYTNYGVYVTIELEQMWPVTVNGKTETLVWRDDLVSAPNIAYLHGTERLASTMIMLQETKQGVESFKAEFR